MDVEAMLRAGGGVVSLRQLAAAGAGRVEQRRIVGAHALSRVRSGWYASAAADPGVRGAVVAGGSLSCIDVLGRLGAWRPLGVSVVHARLPVSPGPVSGAVVHVLPGVRRPVIRAVDDASTAVTCLARCQPVEHAVAVLDSVLHRGLMLPNDLAAALAAAGWKGQEIAARVDPSAESGIESHLRLMLRQLGVRFSPQVRIRGVGRVDFLVGDRLVVEADGLEFHTGVRVQLDRDRDNALQRLGFHIARFTYTDILGRPDLVKATLRGLIARREHRWTTRTRVWEREGWPHPVLGSELPWVAEQWAVSRLRVQKREYDTGTANTSPAQLYPRIGTGADHPAA